MTDIYIAIVNIHLQILTFQSKAQATLFDFIIQYFIYIYIDYLILKQQMLGKETKKQQPKLKKKPNLKIIDTNEQNLFQKLTNKIKSFKNKNEPKSIIKGKKIDNKTILHQLKCHLDDFPVVLKSNKQIDKIINNTTLNLNKQNKECFQYHINRPNSSIPFREIKRPKKQDQRRKKSSSISINDINDTLDKNDNNTKNLKKIHKIDNKTLHLQLDDDKQNRYSLSRNSFALERNSFGGEKRFRMHNKSCNDEEPRSRYYKSKTPVSKSTKRVKYFPNQLQKNNFSCVQIIDVKNTASLQKEVRKIKKKKQINNEKQKRRYSVNLINPQKITHLRNDKSKEIQKIDLKKLKKPKKSIVEIEKPLKKKKQSYQNIIINPINPDNILSHRPRKSLNNQQNMKYIQNLKKKKPLIQKQVSEEEEHEYPPPKFSNIKKKKSKSEKPFNNQIYKKILSNGSLIKSSLQTSKKSSHQQTVQYERITELQQQGTSIKKLHSNMLQQQGFSLQLNINEIRQYERLSFLKKFKKQKYRKQLYVQIHEQYPQLNQQEIIFLASVIFIQRKWREFSTKSKRTFRKYDLEFDQVDQKMSNKSEQGDFKQPQLLNQSIENSLHMQSENKESLKDPSLIMLIQKKQKQLALSSVGDLQLQNKYKQYQQREDKNLKMISMISDRSNMTNKNMRQVSIDEQFQNNIIRNFKRKPQERQEQQIELLEVKQSLSRKSSQQNKKQIIKIKTQISENSDSFNLEKQLFPPDELINIQKRFLMNNFETNLQKLQEMYINSNIDTNRFQSDKYSLQKQLENSVIELKKSNKDIEKGYLKYIDCIKNIKQQAKKPKKKLRKVSSQNGLMAKLYLKFFKVQSSNDSDSLKKLKRKLLIRKEYFQNKQDQMLLTLGDQLSDRVLRRDFHKFTPLMDRQDSSQLNFQQWQSIGRKVEIKSAVNDFIQQIEKKQKAQSMNSLLINLHTSSEQQQQINIIEYNKKKQENCIEISQQIFFKIIQQFQDQISQNQSLLKKMKSKQEKKKRNLPGLSSIKYKIMHYVNSFFDYIIKNYLDQILNNFNTFVGFSPISYLKIIRDHEYVEPEEYIPMISNKIYVQYEPIYFSQIPLDKQLVKFQNFLRAIVSINNKALFQAIVVQLQRLRPYGEQGLPYPWDSQPIYKRDKISRQKFLKICEIVKSNIKAFDERKCGIILEKYLIRNSDELQKLHQQKQDCLINTIQQQLKQQQQPRYQLNEQILEIKLNITHWMTETILIECSRQIWRFAFKNQF